MLVPVLGSIVPGMALTWMWTPGLTNCAISIMDRCSALAWTSVPARVMGAVEPRVGMPAISMGSLWVANSVSISSWSWSICRGLVGSQHISIIGFLVSWSVPPTTAAAILMRSFVAFRLRVTRPMGFSVFLSMASAVCWVMVSVGMSLMV